MTYQILGAVLVWLGLMGLALCFMIGAHAKPSHWFDE